MVAVGVAEAGPSLDSTDRGGAEAAAMRARMEGGFSGLDRRYAAGLQTEAFSRLIALMSLADTNDITAATARANDDRRPLLPARLHLG